MIANEIAGAGMLSAVGSGGGGGIGRIRLEAFDLSQYTGNTFPGFTFSGPGLIFPLSDAPVVRAVAIDGQPVPSDPGAGVETKDVVVQDDLVLLEIEANNIPPGTFVEVQVRPAHGPPLFLTSTPLKGTFALSTAQVIVPLPDVIPAEIQLKANWTK